MARAPALLLGWIWLRQAVFPIRCMKRLLLGSLLLLLGGACFAEEGETIQIRKALDAYCVKCHGPEKQKGERRFDELAFPLKDTDSLILTQDVIDQLVHGDMPPSKADQPTEKERLSLIDLLNKQRSQYQAKAKSTGGETVLRRLNQREYRNTVRDLLKVNLQMFDPARQFPREQTAEHFDNVGDALVTSGYLLEQYLESADLVIEKALSPEKKPEVKEWHFTAPWVQQPELTTSSRRAFKNKYLFIHETINSENHWGEYASVLKFQDGVPVQGYYEIELLIQGMNRDHPHEPRRVDIDKDEPMWVGIIPGNIEFGELHNPQPFEDVLAKIPLEPGEAKWEKRRVWLDEGFTPRFIYINGPSKARGNQSGLGLKLLKEEGKGNNPFGSHYTKALLDAQLPHIRIHEVRIKGPFYDSWPTESRVAVVGKDKVTPDSMEQVIERFASRAYRRPVTADEKKRLMIFAKTRMGAGREIEDAVKDTLKTVLCAPAFLYLDDRPVKAGSDALASTALASRLSYFLWSSMPDERLMKLANSGELKIKETLISELDRMLKDPRSDAFYDGFLDSWLTLRDLGGMPPDRREFSIYYEKNLHPLMLEETQRFTRHLIEKNLSLINFLDSDFTFVNKTLAQFYGLPPMKGYEFQKVALKDRRRGGLLGQASVLTVTANGIETSPVVRGVWVLENVFGTPPSPPPDDVEPLDPDVRGAKTIREQLAKHRNVAACNECHRKIDPPGFALENFDPIGRWRTKYDNRQPVDATGQLNSGESFEDVVDFKKALMNRKDAFAVAVVEKLLTYAAGRRMEVLDRAEVDRIVEEVKDAGYGMQDVMKQVVQSEIFLSK